MIKNLSIILAVAFFSCKSSAAGTAQKDPLIIMEKTACMGECPVYKIQIFEDGTAKLHAEQNLQLKGDYVAQLNESKLDSLVTDFKEKDFFGFEDKYTANVTDLPTTYIEFHYEGQSKKITDYYNAPEELKTLEKKVASLVDELEWKEVED